MEILVKRLRSLFEQAEDLVHFYYEASNARFLLVDLEGADYKLYDPDIPAITPSVEQFFCTSNLREITINDLFTVHKCTVFCLELKMAETELEESELDKE